MINRLLLGIVILATAAVTISSLWTIPTGSNNVYSQSSPTAAANRTTSGTQAPAEHESLMVSTHIPLTGQLSKGDYIHLMDFTPFKVNTEGHSHIAMKVPCNENASPKITIVTGIAPNFKTLDIGNAINNGTLNEKNLDLSAEGRSCLYHAELPNGITDIALINTSNETLNFDEGGYSVTVSVHGTAIQHIGSNQTTGSSS
jgi:hypothetical protein